MQMLMQSAGSRSNLWAHSLRSGVHKQREQSGVAGRQQHRRGLVLRHPTRYHAASEETEGRLTMVSPAQPNLQSVDWSKVPAPVDDGAARHLAGAAVPDVALPATDGSTVSLGKLKGRTVVFAYPRTGRPGQPSLAPDWDQVPGARGCTPQSCGFRDHFAELKGLGVARMFGLSTQDTGYQHEAVERLHLPFPVLSDAGLRLARAIGLPTFTIAGMTLHKRMVLVIDDGAITKAFYPVFPPDKNAEEVIAWLRASSA